MHSIISPSIHLPIYLFLIHHIFTFTFMHLADAFIQSDLQCIQVIHLLSVCVFPGNLTHNLCAANAILYHWATGTYISIHSDIFPSISPSTFISIHPAIMYIPIHPFIYISMHSFIWPSIHLYIYIWPWTTKPVVQGPVKSRGYICSNSQKYIVWVKIIYFSFMPKIIRILSKDHVPWRYFVNFQP